MNVHTLRQYRIKDLQLAVGTHTVTDTQTLISMQASQTHFQVLSIAKGGKMFFTISDSSPLRVEQIHAPQRALLNNTSIR